MPRIMLAIVVMVLPSMPTNNMTIPTTMAFSIVATQALQLIDQPRESDFLVRIALMISPIFHPLCEGSITRELLVGKQYFVKRDLDPAGVVLFKRTNLKVNINLVPV